MKKVIVFLLITVFGVYNSKGQENSCPLEIYKLVFEEAHLYKNKAVEIEVGYKPNEYTINCISQMNIFNEIEIQQFNKFADDKYYSHCVNLKTEIKSLSSNDRIGKNGSYMRFEFSSMISFSDSKKAILMRTIIKNKKYKGGKPIGGEEIYILSKNNNKWILEDRKIIVLY